MLLDSQDLQLWSVCNSNPIILSFKSQVPSQEIPWRIPERWCYHRRFTKLSKELLRELPDLVLFLLSKKKGFSLSLSSFSLVIISSPNALLGLGSLFNFLTLSFSISFLFWFNLLSTSSIFTCIFSCFYGNLLLNLLWGNWWVLIISYGWLRMQLCSDVCWWLGIIWFLCSMHLLIVFWIQLF